MKKSAISIFGLTLLVISQSLLSRGHDFLMAQKPIDFAHWAMLIGSVCLFALWKDLPENVTKKTGLTLMTIGIAAVAGMCTIDFLLWAAHEDPELKEKLFKLIFENPILKHPFLTVGPSLFYGGICIATYGLIKRFTWQVIILNVGALFIGLGHMVFQNRIIPVLGVILLTIGLCSIFNQYEKEKS